jgi:molybdate transport system ATP-binding protein
VMDLIHAVVEQGAQVLLAAHDATRLPAFVTHVVCLRSGRIADQGPVSELQARPITTPASAISLRAGSIPSPQMQENESNGALIRVENADIAREGKTIVRRITWTVRAGQNWALLGKNGSGKTTLLKLVVGDLRPVWGGKISRFGLEGPQSIWEMRSRISLVTPDLQAMHASRQTAIDMVLSGFYGSVGLPREPTERQKAAARSWFQRLDLAQLENREVRTLSYGQVRALLVMRAVVTNPTILLLDEPLSGLDGEIRRQVMSIVEKFSGNRTSVVYVTHDKGEISPLFDHVAVLEKGTMVFQGSREQWHQVCESLSRLSVR